MTTSEQVDTVWKDKKRYLWVLGLIAPSLALVPSQFVLYTGITAFWWLGPVFVFVIIPVLDTLVGEDGQNPPDEVLERLSADRYYRWCTFLFLPVLLISMVIAAYLWSQDALSIMDKIGLATSLGVANGVGINAAHELGHRVEKYEQVLAKIALAPSCYGHFFVEHNRGHHVRVATPEDPASSRFGETLWRFLPRTVSGSFRSAIRLERRRLARKHMGFWTPKNHILQSWSLTILLFGSLFAVFGPQVAPYLLLQAAVGIFLLESVNYVEHYGLLRQKRPDGRYEQCSPRHSWNSDRLVTNIFLFHLQRHSDHHANPSKRYQVLRSYEESPQLPAGYATMLVLAMVPPLFRKVMDPRVLAHYNGDPTLINLAPRLQAKVPV